MRIVAEDPQITSKQVADEFNSSFNEKSINASFFRKLLCKKGLKSYVSKKKPFLSKKMKEKRLKWCKRYDGMPIDYWRNVIFSDESMIELKFGNIGSRVRRFSWENPFKPQFLRRTVKHSIKLMFWGCFCNKKIGRIGICDGIMNSDKYIDVLEKNLIPFMNEIGRHLIYQQDGAPCHTSRKSVKWLEDHNIEVLDWPGNSPVQT